MSQVGAQTAFVARGDRVPHLGPDSEATIRVASGRGDLGFAPSTLGELVARYAGEWGAGNGGRK